MYPFHTPLNSAFQCPSAVAVESVGAMSIAMIVMIVMIITMDGTRFPYNVVSDGDIDLTAQAADST
jgi:hypothetical protein